MCGVTALLRLNNTVVQNNDKIIFKSILNDLTRRGPDYSGIWNDEHVLVGHTRLAITDESQSGNQPMVSDSGRYVMSFNGEIYNHKDLRDRIAKQIGKVNYRSGCDAESLIRYIDTFGFNSAMHMVRGMFAIIVYDIKLKKVLISCDYFGEKKLFYKMCNEYLIISSNITGLSNVSTGLTIDNSFVSDFFKLGFSRGASTIFSEIKSMVPNSVLEINLLTSKNTYQMYTLSSRDRPQEPSGASHIKEALVESVEEQLLGDKPGGLFLSGGVDSTLIAAILKRRAQLLPLAFSADFGDERFNETDIAKQTADDLEMDLKVVSVEPIDAVKYLENINAICGQPFADSSIVSVLKLAETASDYVKYVLTGDGGDEIFFGYNRYKHYEMLMKIRNLVRILGINSSEKFNKLVGDFVKHLISPTNFLMAERLDKALHLATCPQKDLYSAFLTGERLEILLDNQSMTPARDSTGDGLSVTKLRKYDLESYLPNDILFKSDRACMWHSIENRSPFLSEKLFRIVESNTTVNDHIKKNKLKFMIKQMLLDEYPRYSGKLNKKNGFTAPLNVWVSLAIKSFPFAFDTSYIRQQQIFDPQKIINLVNKFKSGHLSYSSLLWSYLCFQCWLEQNRKCV